MKFDLAHRYSSKVKTAEEISALIGQIPRRERVVMCHGVFDIVHPGHIRHFLFAKSKAPILIASLTADQHINKGAFRPHVPQDLRAINLAALDLIDYVLIDENDTPLTNLQKIKPDLFAKGFEYSPDNKIFPKTKEEIDLVKSYGGEVIFTPGDYVLSSSKYITETPPNLKIEKLIMLLSRAEVDFKKIQKTLDSFQGKRVLVVGDTIVDSYTRCSMIGGQTKTPTLSVRHESKEDFVGGAGVVAAHLKAAGADVMFSTVVGDDSLGRYVQNQIKSWGIEDLSIVDRNRPTVNKNAILVDDYRLLKIDTLDNRPISTNHLQFLCDHISKKRYDAVVFSDFRHGIFNKSTIPELTKSIPDGVLKVADSQVASRWGNILEFRNFDLITPNEREARFSLGDQDSGIRSLAAEIFDQSECGLLILKLGSKGIIACTSKDATTLDSYFVMDSFVENLLDPVGAGDALLAYSTLALLTSQSPVISSILGNLAAACECEHDGNIPISRELIQDKLHKIQQEISLSG